MSKDPYRELAQRTRVEIHRVKREQEEPPARGSSSRMERKEEKKQKKYPLLKTLLVFFIALPFITLFWYTNAKDKDYSSATVVTEKSSPPVPAYAVSEAEEEQEDSVDEEEMDEASKQGEDIVAEPVGETAAAAETEQEDLKERPVKEQVIPAFSEEKKPAAQEPAKKAVLSKTEKKEEASPVNKEQPKSGGKVVYHTVKPQETVFRISMMYYKSQDGIEKIRQANGLSGNDIRAGQVLKIPLP